MGMPSIGIYSYELFHAYDVDHIIRVGTAGGLVKDLKLKDIIERLSVLYEVVILTARDTEKVKEWLKENNIVVDEVTNVKPPAVCYVDDRAVRFDGDFNRTLHDVRHFYTFWELNYDE